MNKILTNATDGQDNITLNDVDIEHLLQQRFALRTKVTTHFDNFENALPGTTTGRQLNEIIKRLKGYECQLNYLDDTIEPFKPTEELEEKFTYVIELSDRIVGHLSMLKFKAQLVNQRVTKPEKVEEGNQHLSKQRNTSNTSSFRQYLVRPSELHVTARARDDEVGTVALVSTNYADRALATENHPEQQRKHRRVPTGSTDVTNTPLDDCCAQTTSMTTRVPMLTNKQVMTGSAEECVCEYGDNPIDSLYVNISRSTSLRPSLQVAMLSETAAQPRATGATVKEQGT
ncbi:hypothetical protein HPB47_013092 [Ixodes persulcatus]|uniref:Uncharacterized protein n=1 Tax=Ixodes persulcatus TaxID=34615 RepID=A0AC60NRS9_IXOPE|nr:hypothetical protein HPB47_013092 [Ixodes persulcatus]